MTEPGPEPEAEPGPGPEPEAEPEAEPALLVVIQMGGGYWTGHEGQSGPLSGAVRFLREDDARRVISGLSLPGIVAVEVE